MEDIMKPFHRQLAAGNGCVPSIVGIGLPINKAPIDRAYVILVEHWQRIGKTVVIGTCYINLLFYIFKK
jgi:hypothetical protein